MADTSRLTKLLQDMERGGRHRAEELRVLARSKMAAERPGQTLQATGLVHEAYLRLVGDEDPGWKGRGHFFGAAALAMRRILVEQARRKARLRHGGGLERVDLEQAEPVIEPPTANVVAIDEAVRRLEQRDPRKGRIVNLRYFAGLTTEETARALDLSVGTVEREWRFIRTRISSRRSRWTVVAVPPRASG